MKIWTQFVETDVAPLGPRMSKRFEYPKWHGGDRIFTGEIVSVELRGTGYVIVWVVPDEWEPEPDA